ncbi:hypothetical protein MKW98_003418 [Papaver atlanticum]|uniref:Large ribosomal subunit protein uL10-like insertion domain-containing protein n=1 Tax=Papaver atlanticum TaxID=357466 RepID=A0AAD4XTJ4_9MAGN|nr:hypothetical protein MKW98_003418 [Papaver atlanticum]
MDNEKQREGLKWVIERIVGSWSMMPEERPDISKMSRDQFAEYLKTTAAERNRLWEEHLDKNQKDLIAKEVPLLVKQRREAKKRELNQARELGEYLKKTPLNKKSFISDIERYSSICVFSFGYAKLESSEYKKFIKSLTDDNSYKVYFGRKKALSMIVGVVSEAKLNPELKPGDRGYKIKELRPGLHKIGSMLQNYDDAAVLLTDKTKDEVLRKFKEYNECDFVKTGQTPMAPLVFAKDEVLPLPPRSSAMNLCPKLKELGMPVELSGGCIKLTETFSVCEDGVRVTEDATKILRLLKKKMFNYALVPLCCWSASTGETEYLQVDMPSCQ